MEVIGTVGGHQVCDRAPDHFVGSIPVKSFCPSIPAGDRPIQIDGADLIRSLVLKNQVMVGSVNDAQGHFQMAVDDLGHAHLRWGDHLQKLITQRHPMHDFENALMHHDADEIKVVIEWGGDVG